MMQRKVVIDKYWLLLACEDIVWKMASYVFPQASRKLPQLSPNVGFSMVTLDVANALDL